MTKPFLDSLVKYRDADKGHIAVLHVLKIVHTDLKPANIVLRSSEIVQSRRMRRDEFFFTKVVTPAFRRDGTCER